MQSAFLWLFHCTKHNAEWWHVCMFAYKLCYFRSLIAVHIFPSKRHYLRLSYLLKYMPGFYFLPGSGDLASKRNQPLFRTSINFIKYLHCASTTCNSQKYKEMTMLTSPLAASLNFSAIPTAQKH